MDWLPNRCTAREVQDCKVLMRPKSETRMDDMDEGEVRTLVERGETHDQISHHLKQIYPNRRGISARSVRRFCSQRDIRQRNEMNDDELDRVIESRVSAVGHTYGRRTMHGLLRAEGLSVCQRRVGESLQRTNPFQHSLRRANVQRSVNPVPYRADFFGEKLHLDQNEKLVMYGVVHVLAIDGYSRKLVGLVTMPRKNAITIYNTLFQPVLQQHGLWDQVRTDHGTEFVLVSTVQQFLAPLRGRQHRCPVLKTTSRHNHRAERIWPEINSRINYPIKRVLVSMEEQEEIDMNDDLTKFCVSWVTINVLTPAIQKFVSSWNSHRIPGGNGGVPNVLARVSNETTPLQSASVPSVDYAVTLHENAGGTLSPEGYYGVDPIAGYPQLQELRLRDFKLTYPSMDELFEDVLHHHGAGFKQAIHFFVHLTQSYGTLL